MAAKGTCPVVALLRPLFNSSLLRFLSRREDLVELQRLHFCSTSNGRYVHTPIALCSPGKPWLLFRQKEVRLRPSRTVAPWNYYHACTICLYICTRTANFSNIPIMENLKFNQVHGWVVLFPSFLSRYAFPTQHNKSLNHVAICKRCYGSDVCIHSNELIIF